ncbi:uncharacterized protein PHACADRAFT_255135 [Phanerochaete carnosa HHB-10118-sp]|uniref:Uncharacterized protein n=1 Tax=Phanerochaete carnosa (strain HHB-10118-sp) TaxID=650164 RepID=K5V487_PHACS|nr:uncharacterized protein PHACADRAFT_255135 [Phanerochaete carnosa HHB-10118-sp]EKM57406.1 hypothetical protein PHACADRAFT_255135 [Phanerochaete carnosa HHB-10118-sp]
MPPWVEHGISSEDLIAKCREIYTEMHTFESRAEVHSSKAEQTSGWNGVSMKSLFSVSL